MNFENVEKNQMELESKLSIVRVGGNKSDKQLSEMENITKFERWLKEVIKFHNDYFKTVHKVAYNAKHGIFTQQNNS